MLLFNIIFVAIIIEAGTQSHLLPVRRVNTTVLEILSQYNNYEVIIHVDNTTMKQTHILEDLFSSFQAKLVFNYDIDAELNRPVGYNFISVVFLTNLLKFEQFSNALFNFEYNDVVLLLGEDFPGLFLQLQGFDNAGSVLVLNLNSNDLYSVCYYCGAATNNLVKISSNVGIRRYLNDFTNFNGHHFKIGYMPYLPFFWCKETSNGFTLEGPEGQLLQLLGEILNFRYSLVKFRDYIGGEWRAMVDAVHYKKLDWAVGGISSSSERGQLTDLTRSIHTEMYTVLYCSSPTTNWQLWKQILTPFQFSLWMCVFSVLTFVSLLLKNIPDLKKSQPSLTLHRYFEIALHGLIEQPMVRIPIKGMAKQLLLISWWYTAIIITTAYRSKLASSLINPTNIQPRSLLDLFSNGYSFQVNHNDWSVLREHLEDSVDLIHDYTNILKKTKNNLDICSSVQRSTTDKVAIIDEATTLQYEVIAKCRALLKSEDFSNLRVVEENVFPSYHIWPLQLGAPYRHKFSRIIEDLHSAGILRRWYSLASKKQLPVSNHHNERTSAIALTVSTMTAPVIILTIGLTLATIVFMCEVVYFNLNYVIIHRVEHGAP